MQGIEANVTLLNFTTRTLLSIRSGRTNYNYKIIVSAVSINWFFKRSKRNQRLDPRVSSVENQRVCEDGERRSAKGLMCYTFLVLYKWPGLNCCLVPRSLSRAHILLKLRIETKAVISLRQQRQQLVKWDGEIVVNLMVIIIAIIRFVPGSAHSSGFPTLDFCGSHAAPKALSQVYYFGCWLLWNSLCSWFRLKAAKIPEETQPTLRRPV